MEDVFSRLLRRKTREPSPPPDPLRTFSVAWDDVVVHLSHPDERMLLRGISATPVPGRLQEMVDALVSETNGQDENETGACLEYLLKNDVLGVLERMSESDRPSGVRAEVLNVFNLLVALLDEKFLVHNAVHRPLRRLLRSCVGDEPEELLDGQARIVGAAGSAGKGMPSDYEKDLLELMCMLCKRIRSYPALLMIFFHDKALHVGGQSHAPQHAPTSSPPAEDPDLSNLLARVGSPVPSMATGISSELGAGGRGEPKKDFEFLLFSYLLRFVHRESPIGEFSRAGILFLIDVAFSPGEDAFQTDPLADTKLLLAEYILDGDFAEVLGAGLGAVYSLLPSKLTVHNGSAAEPHAGSAMVLGGSIPDGGDETQTPVDSWGQAELSSSPGFQHHLDTYLKFLEFIQDLIKRGASRSSSPAPDTPQATSTDAQALVGHAMSRAIAGCVKSTFLEHVLYPSILESDPTDGSAVAVLSYIDVMLSTLDPASALAEDLLRFLLADDAATEGRNALVVPNHAHTVSQKPPTASEVKANRRKSSAMILLENMKPSSSSSQYFTSQGRFTLKDLITDNLASSSAPTATAALKLLNTVLSKYASFGLRGLLAVLPDPKDVVVPFQLPSLSLSTDGDDDEDSLFASRPGSPESDVFVYPGEDGKGPSTPPPAAILALPDWVLPQPTTTSTIHARETELYLSLVGEINSSDPSPLPTPDTLPSNYANYLHDAQAALAADRSLTSFQLGLISAAGEPELDRSAPSTSALARHFKLNPSDALLRSVLDRLREFFVHTPEENLALTGALASIALSADLSLEGFLAFPKQEEPEVDAWAEAERKRVQENEVDAADDGEDDKSVDFGLGERKQGALPRMMRSEELNNPFSTDSADAHPILYILFRNLVRKLERYRLQVPEFDHYLSERRRGLLFEETMSDLLLDVDGPPTPSSTSIFSDVSSAVSSPFARPRPPTSARTVSSSSSGPPTTPRPAVKSKWSFLSPSKPKTPTPTSTPTRIDPSTLPYTPRGGGGSAKQTPTSTPHATHYQVTSAMRVERLVAESPKKGVWSPAAAAKARVGKGTGGKRSGLGEERVLGRVGEESQFGLGSDEDEEEEEEEGEGEDDGREMEREREERYEGGGGGGAATKMSLSQVLDNVVILEECLKELVAITVVRLASGVDTMSHL